MIDLAKVNETKEKIISVIKTSGPSFPTRIAREANISPLFVSAFLAELVSERKLAMSSMRIGSSPLYFVPGQESQLENFIQYLNSKEKEAVIKLKQEQILEDEKQEPAIRIALRKIKDFAVPFTLRTGNEEKIFWKFFTLSDNEAKEKIKNIVMPEQKKAEISKEKIKKNKEKKESGFAKSVKDYLQGKNIEILSDISLKPKEYSAKVSIDTPLGKQELLLISKDKKKITEDDLAIAVHKAQSEKMPALILTNAELDKNAVLYLQQWKNLLKFEKLKF